MATHSKLQVDAAVAQEKFIERTSKDFTHGVCSGYFTYYDEYEGRKLTDLDLYAFLLQNIKDVCDTNQFNAGYCSGWIEALMEDRQLLYPAKNKERV